MCVITCDRIDFSQWNRAWIIGTIVTGFAPAREVKTARRLQNGSTLKSSWTSTLADHHTGHQEFIGHLFLSQEPRGERAKH